MGEEFQARDLKLGPTLLEAHPKKEVLTTPSMRKTNPQFRISDGWGRGLTLFRGVKELTRTLAVRSFLALFVFLAGLHIAQKLRNSDFNLNKV